MGLTQGRDGGGTLLFRNNLGVDVVVQGVEDGASEESDEDDNDSGWWDGPASRRRGFSGDDFATVGDGHGRPSLAPSDSTISDVSLPIAVPAGQAIECQLPARQQWANGVAAELVVYVPGFQTVGGVTVGSRGVAAYTLTQLSPPLAGKTASIAAGVGEFSGGGGASKAAKRSRGVAERLMGMRASVRKGLALVVDVREKGVLGSTGNVNRRAVNGGLVAELRTNVCVQNASASDVEINMGQAAVASAVVTAARLTNSTSRRDVRQEFTAAGDGRGAAATVLLAPGARLALPLSVLASWQLGIAGDATDAWSRPLRLSPALLDPGVPNALRLTGGMERNSICLRLAKSTGRGTPGGVTTTTTTATTPTAASAAAAAAAARGEPYSFGTPEGGWGGSGSSPHRDGRDRKSLGRGFNARPLSPLSSVGSTRSQDVGDGADTASVKSATTRLKTSPPSPSPSVGTTAATPAKSAGAADWLLVVQPSYVVTNALPCAMEVEILQPPQATGGIVGSVCRDPPSVPGSDESDDSVDTDDTASVASSSTAHRSSGGGGVSGRVTANPTKAAVRNPALDLFFLPTSSGHEAGDRSGGGAGSNRGRRDRYGSGGGAQEGRGGAKRAGHGTRRALPPRSDSQREGYHVTRGFKNVWKGSIGSGQEVKVGAVCGVTARARKCLCMIRES